MDFDIFKEKVISLLNLALVKYEEQEESPDPNPKYWRGYEDGIRVLWIHMNDIENPPPLYYEDPFSKCYQTDHPATYNTPCAIEPGITCTFECPDLAHYSEDDPNEMR